MNRDIREEIRDALAAAADGWDFREDAENLLNAMGYVSDRGPDFEYEDADEFIADHPATNPNTQSERDFLANAVSANFVFQVTDEEIAQSAQRGLFDSGAFDKGCAKTFVFAAVELNGESYPRGRYAAFTREINKRFQWPSVALFKTDSGLITLAFVHRRANRRDADRDVIGSVSLIREIDPRAPSRPSRYSRGAVAR